MRCTVLFALLVVVTPVARVAGQSPGDDEANAQTDVALVDLLSGRHRKGAVPDPVGKFLVRSSPGLVRAALEWLSKHQDEDGRWDCDEFMKHDPSDDKTGGPGSPPYDVAMTALALHAFLEAGHGYLDEDKSLYYGLTIWRGIRFLISEQRDTGALGDPKAKNSLYQHAIATRALCLALSNTGDDRIRPHAEQAVQYLLRAQEPGSGWGYHPRPGSDTSHTFWAVLALESAQRAGIEVHDAAWKGALSWIDSVTDPDFGVVGYTKMGESPSRLQGFEDRYPAAHFPSCTAAGLWIRLAAGQRPRTKIIKSGLTQHCLDWPPTWEVIDHSSVPEIQAKIEKRKYRHLDLIYWHARSGAMRRLVKNYTYRKFHKEWFQNLHQVLERRICKKGAARGSWDPLGAWGSVGGRVYSTSLCTLALLESRPMPKPPKKKKK